MKLGLQDHEKAQCFSVSDDPIPFLCQNTSEIVLFSLWHSKFSKLGRWTPPKSSSIESHLLVQVATKNGKKIFTHSLLPNIYHIKLMRDLFLLFIRPFKMYDRQYAILALKCWETVNCKPLWASRGCLGSHHNPIAAPCNVLYTMHRH